MLTETRLRHILHPFQSVLTTYVLLCALYTTACLCFASVALVQHNAEHLGHVFGTHSSLSPNSMPLTSRRAKTSLNWAGPSDPDNALRWTLASHNAALQDPPQVFSMAEDLFLSKAFSNSLQPMQIIPYLYRATTPQEEKDITVTTLISLDRFQRFARLVQRYQGPVSVAVHVKNSTSHIQELLTELHNMYTSSPLMSMYVDVHLLIDSHPRQFNTWRNVARLYARTDYVMMLDIDFFICTNFRSAMRNSPAIMAKLEGGLSAFVLPAFEYQEEEDEPDSTQFPETKESLISSVKDGSVIMFHATWPGGHNSTDYPRFYDAKPGEVYRVTQYQPAYEPYMVFKKQGPPWCEERFTGYGGNKAACIFEMYLSGISFYVLADHFIMHQRHEYAEGARASERKTNRKIYADFKLETCSRYLKGYLDAGTLNTSRGNNLVEQCRRVDGAARIASKILNERSSK